MRLHLKLILRKGTLPRGLDIITLLLLITISLVLANNKNDNVVKKFLGMNSIRNKVIAESLITPTPTPTPIPTPTPNIISLKKFSATYQSSNAQWGVAKQVSEHTWTLNVGQDSKMASPQEILIALNNYRQNHGSPSLSWSDNLASFAQSRASFFNSSGKLDEHAGFFSYLANPDNQKQVGFGNIGENSSFGYNLEAVHLIEWVYASDEEHNQNQLNKKWTHVGIGVSGDATDLVFGG